MSDVSIGPHTEWLRPPRELRLDSKEVHLWRAELTVNTNELERLRASLSDDEQQRLERFQFPDLQQRFIAARGILRELLATYLQVSPHTLRFEQNRHGKPFLVSDCSMQLRFNLSHSGDLALIAVTHGRDVGIDVERIRSMPLWQQISERFFTAAESAGLRSMAPEQREQAFFEHWVAKEAFVKAIGQGVSFGLDRFELPALADGPLSVGAGEWSLMRLRPGRGYAGAVAAAGTDWLPVLQQWQPGASELRPGHQKA